MLVGLLLLGCVTPEEFSDLKLGNHSRFLALEIIITQQADYIADLEARQQMSEEQIQSEIERLSGLISDLDIELQQAIEDGDTDLQNALELAVEALEESIITIALTPGPQGEPGPRGPQGPAGADGTNGINGLNGANGSDGNNGTDYTVATCDFDGSISEVETVRLVHIGNDVWTNTSSETIVEVNFNAVSDSGTTQVARAYEISSSTGSPTWITPYILPGGLISGNYISGDYTRNGINNDIIPDIQNEASDNLGEWADDVELRFEYDTNDDSYDSCIYGVEGEYSVNWFVNETSYYGDTFSTTLDRDNQVIIFITAEIIHQSGEVLYLRHYINKNDSSAKNRYRRGRVKRPGSAE